MHGRKFFLIVYFSSNFALVGADVSTAIRDALEHFIENKEISGAVTLVARDGEIVSLQATGLSDLSTGRMMEKNDLFRIASMTKPMAGVAIMMLVEEGKLNVDDLVEDHLAEFKNQWMIDERSKDTLTLKRSSRKITIFDLLTHTAGVSNVEITGFTDGMSWGLAFQVVKEPQGVTSMLSPGTFGHGGAYGTQSWADPVNQTIYILMIQRRGFLPNGDDSIVRKAFQQAAFDSLK
jgi:CubicO group peptidase (beta-lactamase class C family)